ncbi:DegV family protein [Velocimicrobium porci]|uniref:DegV family protein n=1 Tax=Velocimicrobium porci TaxID=2606634 RepID=A0A6L5XUI3_9FIRM|nr:DegV family protein [Velocimicrobium porci]MSS62435.1 DegV family protein [Velocimicrobium porci]
MNRIAVVTDSNSGITQSQAEKLGVYVLPMPFTIDGDTYFEDINLTQEEFYQRLQDGSDISTSQPAVGDILDLWDKLLEEYDEIVHIPMSSGLSGSCSTAMTLADDYDGKVQVVNNQRISVTQRQSVLDAKELAEKGQSAKEIKEYLEKTKFDSSIYIMVDTLKYLKKGGRITAAAAAIGTVLNLKPVLQIQGEKLDSYAKVRGLKQAKSTMIEAIQKDQENRFADTKGDKSLYLQIAHTNNEEAAKQFAKEIEELFPGYEIFIAPLSLSVACHIGPGSLAFACTCKMK